jgi:drug/metabolite transporter (DMT)-like permease
MSTALLLRLAPALFVLMWATGFVVARLTAGHVEPLTFLAIRFPLAAGLMLGWAFWQKALWPDARGAAHAGIAGALLHGLYLGAVYLAVSHGLPGGVAALIVGLQPLITVFMSGHMLGEGIDRMHGVGLGAGLGGITLVVLPKLSLETLDGITPFTASLAVIGAIGASWGTVYQKKHVTGVTMACGLFWQYIGATIVVLTGALLFEDFGFDGSAAAWVALAWSVIVLSLGAITLLMLMIRDGNVSRISSLMFLVPGVSALMTYLLFGETLTPAQLAGMAVCGAAVAIVSRSGVNRSERPLPASRQP